MAENWLAVADVSKNTRIPAETLRRYIRVHGHHLNVRKVNKKYQIHAESLAVIQQIRDLYAAGKNIEEVDQSLADAGVQLILDVDPESHDRNHDRNERYEQLEKQLLEVKEKLDQQQEFNRLLLSRLDQQQKYIEERDQKLLESIQQLQEEKKAILEVATSIPEEDPKEDQQPKRGFLHRLFGGK